MLPYKKSSTTNFSERWLLKHSEKMFHCKRSFILLSQCEDFKNCRILRVTLIVFVSLSD